MATPICSTSFMENSLTFFTRELVYSWLEDCKKLDEALSVTIKSNLDEFAKNDNHVSVNMETDFIETLNSTGIHSEYNLANLEAFHGYTVYGFPDNGKINEKSGNPDLYYGLAKASIFGIAHTHKLSDAFNYILDGEGVFTGDQQDKGKFPFYYHGDKMLADVPFEIPIGMTHGHLVKDGKEIWFLFVQECGFKPKLKCAGDFYTIDDYDRTQFGPYYI